MCFPHKLTILDTFTLQPAPIATSFHTPSYSSLPNPRCSLRLTVLFIRFHESFHNSPWYSIAFLNFQTTSMSHNLAFESHTNIVLGLLAVASDQFFEVKVNGFYFAPPIVLSFILGNI